MIWRTYSVTDVEAAIEPYKEDLAGEPVDEWMNGTENIALRNTKGDVALFEFRQKGVYTGHYFFISRGKEAIATAEDMLSEIFSPRYDVDIIVGMTPLDKKGAIWMSRRIGFTSMGDADIGGRAHRIFVITKKDFQ